MTVRDGREATHPRAITDRGPDHDVSATPGRDESVNWRSSRSACRRRRSKACNFERRVHDETVRSSTMGPGVELSFDNGLEN